MTSGQEERDGLQGSSSHRGSQIENCDDPQRSEQTPVPQQLPVDALNLDIAEQIRQMCLDRSARVLVPILQKQNIVMLKALQSIARNTCCDKCQEAALIARKALAKAEASHA